MNKDEVIEKLKEIGNTEDEVKRRELITDITDNLEELYVSKETLEAENTSYKEQVEKDKEDLETLREANMKLFLRVGNNKTPEELEKDLTGKEEKEPRKYTDLFDEKGNLKEIK